MKKLTLFALAATVLFGLALSQVSYAQVDPTGNPQNRGVVKPNFVDEDGDGICDNNTGTGGIGTGSGQMGQGGQGQGQGSGSGNGTGTRQRLRDGSCLDGSGTAAPTGSATMNNNRGRAKGTSPAK